MRRHGADSPRAVAAARIFISASAGPLRRVAMISPRIGHGDFRRADGTDIEPDGRVNPPDPPALLEPALAQPVDAPGMSLLRAESPDIEALRRQRRI